MNFFKWFFYFKKFNWFLLIIPLLLSLIGLLSLYSQQKAITFFYFQRQAIFLGIGLFLFFLFSFFDWRVLKDNSFLVFLLYLFSLALLGGLFLFAPLVRGTRSWYKIGTLTFDPTEFTKLILIILFAKYFSQRHIEMYRFYHIVLSGVYLFLPLFLVYLQPDLGSVLIFLFIWIGVLIISGIRIRHFLVLSLLGIIVFLLAWNFLLKDYQKERIFSFLFPNYKPLEIGWSQRQAKIALGSGGLLGRGFQKGVQTQLGFLPESHTDFIFSSIGEEFGFLTLFLIIILYVLLFWQILKIAIKSQNNFARIFSLGVGCWILGQLFINIGSNIGLLPVIGVPLPFISYGGSSLIALYIAMGLLESMEKSIT